MQLNNIHLPHERLPVSITVTDGKISAIGPNKSPENSNPFSLQFTDALAIPGLINSHDHLEFNCYTFLSQCLFKNYTEWGRYIHKFNKSDINAVLKIPENLRAAWGMYKNLLNGVTTVVNHGSFLKIEHPLIGIQQDMQNLHSVHFEKNWIWKLNNPRFINRNCVIHAGEGIDEQSATEIDHIIRFNLIGRNLIGVHGVAMKPNQARHFKGLIWCPESNRVLLNKHAAIEQLRGLLPIAFGTDSTLTGSWNIWQHLRLARSLHKVNDAELFDMTTSCPAKLWNLNKGLLQTGKDADILIVRKRNKIPNWDDIYATNPKDILLVMHNGKIRLMDTTLLSPDNRIPVDLSGFCQVRMQGSVKFVEGDLPGLIAGISSYYPDSTFPVQVLKIITHSARD